MTSHIEYITPTYQDGRQESLVEDISEQDGYSCFDEFDNYVEENCLLRAKILSEPVHKVIHYTDHTQLDLFNKPKEIKEETVTFTVRAPMRFQSERGRLIEIESHEVVISNEEVCFFSAQTNSHQGLQAQIAQKVFQKGSYVLLKGSYMFQHFNVKSAADNTQTVQRSLFMITHEEDHIVPNHNPTRVAGWSEQNTSQKTVKKTRIEQGVFDNKDFSDYFPDRKAS